MGLNLQIEIADDDEHVFIFETFELVLHPNGNYLLSDEGYFSIDGLASFKPFDDEFVVVNEDSKLFITPEDFEKIKGIYLKFV